MKPTVTIGILIFICAQVCVSSQQLVSNETKDDGIPNSSSPALPYVGIDEELDQYSAGQSIEKEKPSAIFNEHSLLNKMNSSVFAPSSWESIGPPSQSVSNFSHYAFSSPGSTGLPSQSDISSLSSQTLMKVQAEERNDSQTSTTSRNGISSLAPQNPDSSSSSTQNSSESIPVTKGNSSKASTTPSNDDVVLKPDEIPSYTKAILQKSIAWMNDTYTLSIVIPIAAGFVFAAVVIVVVSFVNCVRRRCFRRRYRRKVLPDTIRNMKPSDRARLLADTSDEEF